MKTMMILRSGSNLQHHSSNTRIPSAKEGLNDFSAPLPRKKLLILWASVLKWLRVRLRDFWRYRMRSKADLSKFDFWAVSESVFSAPRWFFYTPLPGKLPNDSKDGRLVF